MKLPSKQISKVQRLKMERSMLRKYLKWGDLASIANLAGVNVQVVYRWFKGEIVNSTVGPYIELLAESRKSAIKKSINEKM